jgi:tetratricopeptide (TPR) repeat protein
MDVLRARVNDRLVRKLLIVFAVAGALGALGIMKCQAAPSPRERCLETADDVGDGLAVMVCKRVYDETGDPPSGIQLASSLRRVRRFLDAKRVATGLLATSAHANAVQVLGRIAIDQDQLELGHGLLSLARALHTVYDDPGQLALDEQSLANIFRRDEHYFEALAALDRCITAVRKVDDDERSETRARRTEGYCHNSAATILADIGYFDGAKKEIEEAASRFRHDRELAQLELDRVTLYQHAGFGPSRRGRHRSAVVALQRAIIHAGRAGVTRLVRSAELNLAFSLAEIGELDQAAHHLDIARSIDHEGIDTEQHALLEARIAYRGGDLARATAINTAVYDELVESDDKLRVCVMQAEIALTTGDVTAAIEWATRGVEVVEALRAKQGALELRAWTLTLRRQPYEQLFVALARAHRFEDALSVVDSWQGRSLLDAIARTQATQQIDLRTMGMQADELRTLFPVLARAPIVPPLDRAAALAAVRDVDLVAIVLANEDVWRITAHHGALDIVNVGTYAELRPLLDELAARPTLQRTPATLGSRLLGDAAFRDTTEPLFVLLDGLLGNLPIAALRAHGRPLPTMRPMVRASRLSELGCVPATPRPRHATILANAQGDLLAAWQEAIELGARLRVVPAVAAAATSTRLFAAAKDDLLHVAVHGIVEPAGGGSLALYDRNVSGPEIAVRGPGSALVVLSACASSASDDGELGSSLATGFLASGSVQVVATLRPVTDVGAREVIDAFYRDDGIADPVRALARVQAALSTTTNADWPNFAVFGHDLCRKELP